MERKRITKKWIIHCVITFILVVGVIGVIAYKTLRLKLPDDGKHKDTTSRFVCVGCHNNARNGGSSRTFHFDRYQCVKCHIPRK